MWLSIISFVFVFLIVALAHEGGHYIWAKRAGIRVLEFGVGFGPTIFSFTKDKTKFNLHLIPILAYVALAGIDDLEERPAKKVPEAEKVPEKERYYTKTAAQKFMAIVAGPLFNIALAILIVYFLGIFVGLPIEKGSEIVQILPNSEAQAVGLQVGDSIISINGIKTEKAADIIKIIYKNPNQKINLQIKRRGTLVQVWATPRYDTSKKIGMLGFLIKPVVDYQKVGPIQAIFTSTKEIAGMVILIIVLLGQLLAGQIPLTSLAGPVGIAQISGQVAHQGFLQLLWFIALISVNLGVVNLLPLPALDGGRLVFISIEWIRRGKAINIKIENQIHQYALMGFLALLALITVIDIRRIMGW